MEGLLQAVSTSYTKPTLSTKDKNIDDVPSTQLSIVPASCLKAEDVCELLRNQPSPESLLSVLQGLVKPDSRIDLHSPSPVNAQIVHLLATEIVPAYWEDADDEQSNSNRPHMPDDSVASCARLLPWCFRNVGGLNAILFNVRRTIQEHNEIGHSHGKASMVKSLKIFISLLKAVVDGDVSIEDLYAGVARAQPDSAQKRMRQELMGILAGSKVLNIAAEAERVINQSSSALPARLWLADGLAYCAWIGRNVDSWSMSLSKASDLAWKSCADFLSRSLRLGHTGV